MSSKRAIKVDRSLAERISDGDLDEDELDEYSEALEEVRPAYDKSTPIRDVIFGYLEPDAQGCVSRQLKDTPPVDSSISKADWKKYKGTLRRRDIVRLHAQGKSFNWIADYFDYAGTAGARYHWNAALKELNEDSYADVEKFRAKAALRYEHWLSGIAERIEKGDLGAMDRGIKMTESLARMFGANLERNENIQQQVNVGGVVVVHGDEAGYVESLLASGQISDDAAKAIRGEITAGEAPVLDEATVQAHLDRNEVLDEVSEEIEDAELVED